MKLTDRKVWISLACAVVFGAAAVSSLAARFNYSIRVIPAFLGSDLALKIFLLLAGILLLYDAVNLRTASGHIRLSAIIAALLFAFLGAFPLLDQFGLLDFLPFVVEFTLSSAVLAGVLLFYSLYLLWDVYLFLSPKY